MKAQRGFSLIELLIVVMIIGVISAIAIPGLKRAKMNAQTGSAIQSLRTITTAEHLYERKHREYAFLIDLVPEGSIDSNLGFGVKSGYQFQVLLFPDANISTQFPSGHPNRKFTCTAEPMDDPTNRPFFFVDETAVIKVNDGAPATAASPAIPR